MEFARPQSSTPHNGHRSIAILGDLKLCGIPKGLTTSATYVLSRKSVQIGSLVQLLLLRLYAWSKPPMHRQSWVRPRRTSWQCANFASHPQSS
jgi:hypothetical protein